MADLLLTLRNWLARADGEADDQERGASLVEYALLVVLIAVICVAAVTILGEQTSDSFSSTGSAFTAN